MFGRSSSSASTASRCRASAVAGSGSRSPKRLRTRPRRSCSIPIGSQVVTPPFDMPPGGLNIRWPDPPNDQEYRLQRYKLEAALAFAHSNQAESHRDRRSQPALWHRDERQGAFGRAAGARGPGHRPDTRERDRHQAFQGRDELAARARGDPAVRRRPRGNLVVEEKRGVVENQLKEQLYNWQRKLASADHRQARRARRVDAALQRRAHAGIDRARAREEDAAVSLESGRRGTSALSRQPRAASRRPSTRTCSACRISARAARTTLRRECRKEAVRSAASAATSWRAGWTAIR